MNPLHYQQQQALLLWRHISPRRLWLYGWLTFAAVFAIAPITVNWTFVPFSVEVLVFLLACNAAFLLGTLFVRATRAAPLMNQTASLSPQGVRLMFWLGLIVGFIGGTFRVIDRYVIRGLGAADDLSGKYEALSSTQTSGFGIAAGPMFPFLLLMPFLYLQYSRMFGSNRGMLLVSLAAFSFVPIEAATTGSRSTTLLALGLGTLYALDSGAVKLELKRIALLMLAAFTLLLMGGWIFLLRLRDAGISPAWSASGGSAYAETVPAAEWAQAFFMDGSDLSIMGHLIFSLTHFCQYYSHGVFELFRLFESFNTSNLYGYGSYTFALSYKIMGMFINLPTADDLNPRSGVFTTFFGPTFVDFGWFAIFICGLYGFIAQLVWRQALYASILSRPFYFIVAVAVFFIPVIDMLSSSISAYLLTSSLILAVCGWMLKQAEQLPSSRYKIINKSQ